MEKKKLTRNVITTVLTLALLLAVTIAWFIRWTNVTVADMVMDSVANDVKIAAITSGGVSIDDLDKYEYKEIEEGQQDTNEYIFIGNIIPGDVIEFEVAIENDGEPCVMKLGIDKTVNFITSNGAMYKVMPLDEIDKLSDVMKLQIETEDGTPLLDSDGEFILTRTSIYVPKFIGMAEGETRVFKYRFTMVGDPDDLPHLPEDGVDSNKYANMMIQTAISIAATLK